MNEIESILSVAGCVNFTKTDTKPEAVLKHQYNVLFHPPNFPRDMLWKPFFPLGHSWTCEHGWGWEGLVTSRSGVFWQRTESKFWNVGTVMFRKELPNRDLQRCWAVYPSTIVPLGYSTTTTALPVHSTSPPSTMAFSEESTSTIFSPSSFLNTWRTTANWNWMNEMNKWMDYLRGSICISPKSGVDPDIWDKIYINLDLDRI